MPTISNSLDEITTNDTFTHYGNGTIPIRDSAEYEVQVDFTTAGSGGSVGIQDAYGKTYYKDGSAIAITATSESAFILTANGDHFKFVTTSFAGGATAIVRLKRIRGAG